MPGLGLRKLKTPKPGIFLTNSIPSTLILKKARGISKLYDIRHVTEKPER